MIDDNKLHDSTKESISDPRDSGRRKAVKTIIGSVGALTAYHIIPAKWSKPLIRQVFLPAHAATSGSTLNDPCTVRLVSGDAVSGSVVIHVNGFLSPPVSGLSTQIVATPSGAGSLVSVTTATLSDGTFTSDITINGGPGIISVSVTTTVTGAAGTAQCSMAIPASTTTAAPSTPPPV